MAVKQTGIKQIAIGGGVAANSGIRSRLKDAEDRLGWRTFIPKFEYCTDNAGMIAMSGHLLLEAGEVGNLGDVPMPRMTF